MTSKTGHNRKEQIVSAAIDHLYAAGFEGFRLADVAKAVGINNATLIHHYPSKVALINAVVARFTERFEAVADETDAGGTSRERLARHLKSSVALMRTAPEMFVVLNDIMIRAGRDPEIARLVAVPLAAWRRHIVKLVTAPGDNTDAAILGRADEIATACMAQLLGKGLLLNSTDHAKPPFEPVSDRTGAWAIAALTKALEDLP